MAIWWVNLGLQFTAQRDSSTLWCPAKRIRKDGSLGKPFWHWANIADVKQGEFIVLCKSAQILGLAYSTSIAQPDQPKPNGFPLGGRWHDLGWRLPVEFLLFDTPKDRNELTRGLFQKKNKRRPLLNDPKTGKGRGTQIYLTQIEDADAVALFERIGALLEGERPGSIDAGVTRDGFPGNGKPIETTRLAISQARVGQGKFRADLLDMWGSKCCATGLNIECLLVASHIHPWSVSDDLERLDPFNGLLLSAAIDAAFDKGLIALLPDGSWEVVAKLTETQLAQAGLDKLQHQKVSGLTEKHEVYLSRHRRLAREQATAVAQNGIPDCEVVGSTQGGGYEALGARKDLDDPY